MSVSPACYGFPAERWTHLRTTNGWRAMNGPHLVALVRVGATFEGGRLDFERLLGLHV